jgi:hypothetical protein
VNTNPRETAWHSTLERHRNACLDMEIAFRDAETAVSTALAQRDQVRELLLRTLISYNDLIDGFLWSQSAHG